MPWGGETVLDFKAQEKFSKLRVVKLFSIIRDQNFQDTEMADYRSPCKVVNVVLSYLGH